MKGEDAVWAMPPQAHAFLFNHLPEGATVIELGSGAGSKALAEKFELVSVEHDVDYIAGHKHRVIYAPLVDGWYDPAFISELPDLYGAVLVDGPPGSSMRTGFWAHQDQFVSPLLIDDCHRPAELHMALAIAQEREESISIHKLVDGRSFATIGWW